MENLITVIKGCSKKEHKYQKMVYETYYGYALKIVFRYLYRYEKAVDITNDGFVKLFRHFERFIPAETQEANEKMLMAFIKKIMINSSIDELRKGKMSPEIGGIPEEVWGITNRAEEADQQILYKDLVKMIKELPPQYRVVFNLYVIDGFNHLEIADKMKISVGTSKSSLSRARTMLQKSIRKIEDVQLCSI